jgi:Fe2+ transport system protein FeoA
MQRRFKTIQDLKIRERAITISLSDSIVTGKLTAMGVCPGATIEMIRKAPFGDAYYIKVDGIRMALRADEAGCILLEL